jgi:hypothetical protein
MIPRNGRRKSAAIFSPGFAAFSSFTYITHEKEKRDRFFEKFSLFSLFYFITNERDFQIFAAIVQPYGHRWALYRRAAAKSPADVPRIRPKFSPQKLRR